jgi:FkbM family methyltransferase
VKLKNTVKKGAHFFMQNLLPEKLYQYVPQGLDMCLDLRKLPKELHPKVIFDVGANTGQTAVKLHKWFPKSAIHSFEPVEDSYKTLSKNTTNYKNIRAHNKALGDSIGNAEINILADSTMSSMGMIKSDKDLFLRKETISISTVDQMMKDLEIDHLDLLKIDTEGYDLEVLRGAISSLENGKISFLQVEAGMNPFNDRHVPLEHFHEFLKPYEFLPFGLYDQKLEWNGAKRLRFLNPVFISRKLALNSLES